jgi:hypothetical protein
MMVGGYACIITMMAGKEANFFLFLFFFNSKLLHVSLHAKDRGKKIEREI